jgi:hypothetical protein
MKPQDKAVLQSQLQTLLGQINLGWTQAITAAALPIITPQGPAAAPGLVQLSLAIAQQKDAMMQLFVIVKKVVDEA